MKTDHNVTFLEVNCTGKPTVVTSFKKIDNLTVEVWHRNTALSPTKFCWLLEPKTSVIVTDRWSKFEL